MPAPELRRHDLGGHEEDLVGSAPRGADPGAVRELVARIAGVSPARTDTHETHISWVFVAGGRAFKLKKPIVLPFLDYGTAARRRAMCEAEVRLGRRLAPHVYRAVRAVVADGDSLALAPAGDPRALDYLVEMTAFRADATLAAAVSTGSVPAGLADRLGSRLASFHATCSELICDHGALRARREASDNLDELRELIGAALDPTLDRFARFFDASFTAHGSLLDERGRSGRWRKGHGDLRAEHVVLEPELAVVDCLEFDPAMRTLDTADEMSFLVMDLLRLGAEPLASEIVRAYRQAGGDCGADDLVWAFGAHRALVRAKVGLLRAQQTDQPVAGTGAVDELLAVADQCVWRSRSCEVLVICGGPASGKSRLAGSLGKRFAVPVLNTDVVRKELLGLPPSARAGDGAYTLQMGQRTYRALGAQTRDLLEHHPTVIVDGTFHRNDERAGFAAALGGRRSVVFVQCCVPPEVARRRAREREHDPGRVSDASEAIVASHRASPEPFPEVSPARQLMLRTDRDPVAIADDLDAMLDTRLGG